MIWGVMQRAVWTHLRHLHGGKEQSNSPSTQRTRWGQRREREEQPHSRNLTRSPQSPPRNSREKKGVEADKGRAHGGLSHDATRLDFSPAPKGRQGNPPASAARSGLAFLLLPEPGVSLRSTPGCILSAASRLQNRKNPSVSSSFWPQGQNRRCTRVVLERNCFLCGAGGYGRKSAFAAGRP